MPKYCQQPKRTAQTIFDPGPGPRRGFVVEGRVKVKGREWGGGGGVIFGPGADNRLLSVLGFFLVSSGNRQVCADKTAW